MVVGGGCVRRADGKRRAGKPRRKESQGSEDISARKRALGKIIEIVDIRGKGGVRVGQKVICVSCKVIRGGVKVRSVFRSVATLDYKLRRRYFYRAEGGGIVEQVVKREG